MIYKLNDSEMRQIAQIYKIDVEVLAKRLNLEDKIISFLPHEKGVKIETESNENLILRFKDMP